MSALSNRAEQASPQELERYKVKGRATAVLAASLLLPMVLWSSWSSASDLVRTARALPRLVDAAAIPHDIGSAPQDAPFSWGDNDDGQLGQGTVKDNSTPSRVISQQDFQISAMALGGNHAVAVNAQGALLGWGDDSFGQMGNDTTAGTESPESADDPAGVTFTAVSAGEGDSMALSSTGTVYTWGRNLFGQLGLGTETPAVKQPSLVTFPAGTVITAISAGAFSDMALTSTGAVYTWGLGSQGQLGDGTDSDSDTPTLVAAPSEGPVPVYTAISAGASHDLALASDGTAYAWGNDGSGQLGSGTSPVSSSVPVPVQGPAGVTFTQIAAESMSSLALGSDGNVYSWGDNDLGQLGQGSIIDSYVPARVDLPALETFVSVAGGATSGYAISSTGTAWAWGSDFYGQLGDGANGDEVDPVRVDQQVGTSASVIDTGSSASAATLLTGVNQQITVDPIAPMTFGDPPFQPAAQTTSGLPVSYSASGDCTYPGNQVVILGAGECTLVADQAGSNRYNPAPDVTVSFSVAQVGLTLVADNASSTIGTIPAFSYTLSGFVNGNTSKALIGTASCTTTATASSGVGSYPITCTAGTLFSPNYFIATSVPGTLVLSAADLGYALVGKDGSVYAEGPSPSSGQPSVGYYGSANTEHLNSPLVGAAFTPDRRGYWLVGGDGGVFAYGDAQFYGSTGGMHLNKPVVGIASTPDGNGYWLVASDGGVFSYGDAQFYGSTGAMTLNKPILAIAPTPDGGGYWLVASDGGIFAFGDAQFFGSTGDLHLTQPVVGMAAYPGGGGYWLVTSLGDIYNYGAAPFEGSLRYVNISEPIVGIVPSLDGQGYTLAGADGSIYCFGDAGFFGSLIGGPPHAPIVAII